MIDVLFGQIDVLAGVVLAVGAMLAIHGWRHGMCSLRGHDDWTEFRFTAPVGGMQRTVAIDVCRRCGREVPDGA